MIEFTGYLTGHSLKHFYKRHGRFIQAVFIFPILMILPIFVLIAVRTQRWLILTGPILAIIGVVVLMIFQPKIDKMKYVPKRIYAKDGILVYVSDKITQSIMLEEVKEVRDYGEFYSLIFRLGNYSTYFICQKDLLTKGTIEEFEALFEGKVVRKVRQGKIN